MFKNIHQGVYKSNDTLRMLMTFVKTMFAQQRVNMKILKRLANISTEQLAQMTAEEIARFSAVTKQEEHRGFYKWFDETRDNIVNQRQSWKTMIQTGHFGELTNKLLSLHEPQLSLFSCWSSSCSLVFFVFLISCWSS